MPRPTNALIVDDEAHVRTFLRLLLRELGITTTWEAADGAAGLEAVATHQPQLVLLDVSMPVMNGLAVLAQLQERNPDLPVVIVTSQTALATVKESLRLGAAGYVLKHAPKDEALQALSDVLEGLDDADDGSEPEAGA